MRVSAGKRGPRGMLLVSQLRRCWLIAEQLAEEVAALETSASGREEDEAQALSEQAHYLLGRVRKLVGRWPGAMQAYPARAAFFCGCGCGKAMAPLDAAGKERLFLPGHRRPETIE